jgi:hypothetical protein
MCVVQVDASLGRGRDTGAYVDRGERREAPPGRRTWVPDSRRRTLGAVAQCSGLQLPLNAEPQPGWRNGIRGRLKPVCPQGHRGSTPLSGTCCAAARVLQGHAWANHPPSQARAPARPIHGPTHDPEGPALLRSGPSFGWNPHGLADDSTTYNGAPMRRTRTMFVWPATPGGEPATITTRSPSAIRPVSISALST